MVAASVLAIAHCAKDEPIAPTFTNPFDDRNTITRLEVISTPDSARIFIDDADTGFLAPHVFMPIAPGSHSIVLKKVGFLDSGPDTTLVEETKLTRFSASLASAYGQVDVRSTPAGAQIYLDDNYMGQMTPYLLGSVCVGSHTLTLRLNGYLDWGPAHIEVQSAATTSVNATLLSAYGSVVVASDPPGGAIYLDHANTGFLTPKTISSVSIGVHFLGIMKDGYRDWGPQEFEVFSGTPTNVMATLVAKYGDLQISSAPSGAAIELDGEPTGKNTPWLFTDLLATSHEVSLDLRFYNGWGPQTVYVSEGGTAMLSADLILGKGTLSVSSSPSGCGVYLDGRYESLWQTPYSFSNIDAGYHSVQIKAPSDLYADSTLEVPVDVDAVVNLSVSLRYIPPHAKVEMVGSPSISNSSGYANIIGQVRNAGNYTASYTQIFFVIKNSSGAQIGTCSCYADDTSLAPGEQCTFDCWAYPVPYSQSASVEWTITWNEW